MEMEPSIGFAFYPSRDQMPEYADAEHLIPQLHPPGFSGQEALFALGRGCGRTPSKSKAPDKEIQITKSDNHAFVRKPVLRKQPTVSFIRRTGYQTESSRTEVMFARLLPQSMTCSRICTTAFMSSTAISCLPPGIANKFRYHTVFWAYTFIN